ncbi:MAG: hypothetical protein NW215_09275 [Hyphomicrobiales bacterium]|nr:hypothetical protein [Hyphomicrobiales bacterium]
MQFSTDAQNFLIGPAGERLVGYRLNGAGLRARHVAEALAGPPLSLPPARTRTIAYAVNLPPDAPQHDWPDAADAHAPLDVMGCDAGAFFDASLPGGSIGVWTALGAPARLTFRWLKAGVGRADSLWRLFYLVNRRAGFAETAWAAVPAVYARADCPKAVTMTDVAIHDARLGEVTIEHGVMGVTHFRDAFSTVKIKRLAQDGAPKADLIDLWLSDGRLHAVYSDGRSTAFAELEDAMAAA